MNSQHIEVHAHTEEGYRSLVEHGQWRVAVLNYIEELDAENITGMQKHTESDEVFVLLSGRCILYTGGSGEAPDEIDSIELEPGKLYNVKMNVWHTHTLDREASVLIVENLDTDRHGDSPIVKLTQEQREKLAVQGFSGR